MPRRESMKMPLLLGVLGMAVLSFFPAPLQAASKEEKVQRALDKAEDYLAKQKADWAEKQYRRAFKLSEGESVEAALGIARLDVREENYDEAMSYARRAVEKATKPEDQAAGHYLLGQASFFRKIAVPENLASAAGDLSNPIAETAFKSAIEAATPVQPAAFVMLMELLAYQGRRAEARKVLAVLDQNGFPAEIAHRIEAIRCELEMLQYEGEPAPEFAPPVLIPDTKSKLLPPNSFPFGEGTVVLAFVVDEGGKPRCVRLLRSFFGTPPSQLEGFAESTFEPATVSGVPIPVRSLQIFKVESSLSFSTF